MIFSHAALEIEHFNLQVNKSSYHLYLEKEKYETGKNIIIKTEMTDVR